MSYLTSYLCSAAEHEKNEKPCSLRAKAGDPMKLTRLCKAADSWGDEKCPAMYVDENPTQMVGQGKRLDEETLSQLLQLADDETGVAIPTETVLRAGAMFLAAHGRPDLADEIESFVNRWVDVQP